MQRDYDYSVLQTDDEAQQHSDILAQSFVVGADQELTYLQQVGYHQGRILRRGDRVLGGLAMFPMGQWFGGQLVTMTGIGSVAIAPECRGQGAAKYLMESAIQELAQQGIALSTLYPAVQALYENVGYGQGGTHCRWQVTTTAIPFQAILLPVYRLEPDPGLSLWRSCRQQFGTAHSGSLDRHPYLWQRLFQSQDDSPIYAYGFGRASEPQGYLVYHQQRRQQNTTLVIRDWYASSQPALTSLWGFLSQHRSQVDQIYWAGGAIDPLVLALPERSATVASLEQWMVRICHLSNALTQRGYAPGITAELHLRVEDPLIATNCGNFVLSVQGGRGSLHAGGRGEVQLSIQALAPLFTGLYSAQALSQLGYLTAPAEAAALATALFASGSPWLADFF
jgi:predicted acetyltransferase